jgi:gluconate 5-dehydrogenase/3-oxoacyl-[acyl-carrier protein] reductase
VTADILGLAGRRVLVAGAGGTVGGALAAALAQLGACLVLHTGRDAERGEDLVKRLAADHDAHAVAVAADVTDEDQLRAMADKIRAAGVDGLDVLITCVTGYRGWPAPVADLTPAEFRRVVDVDLVGTFMLVRALLPMLAQGDRPRIMLLSSLAGVRGRPFAAHLCAAKAGVAGLGLALAKECGPAGITVNVLAPGPVHAPGTEPPPGTLGPGIGINMPEAVAAAIIAGVSDLNAATTGQVLLVNGGQP